MRRQTFKVHLDGYNQLPFLTGQRDKSEREEFEGTLVIWAAPFVCRRLPKIFNLRFNPYEQADITSNTTTTRRCNGFSCSFRLKRSSSSSSRHSRSSRLSKSRRASALSKCWSKCRAHRVAEVRPRMPRQSQVLSAALRRNSPRWPCPRSGRPRLHAGPRSCQRRARLKISQ
jgi:hypothetical protein